MQKQPLSHRFKILQLKVLFLMSCGTEGTTLWGYRSVAAHMVCNDWFANLLLPSPSPCHHYPLLSYPTVVYWILRFKSSITATATFQFLRWLSNVEAALTILICTKEQLYGKQMWWYFVHCSSIIYSVGNTCNITELQKNLCNQLEFIQYVRTHASW